VAFMAGVSAGIHVRALGKTKLNSASACWDAGLARLRLTVLWCALVAGHASQLNRSERCVYCTACTDSSCACESCLC
jgi:hypothetical protein